MNVEWKHGAVKGKGREYYFTDMQTDFVLTFYSELNSLPTPRRLRQRHGMQHAFVQHGPEDLVRRAS